MGYYLKANLIIIAVAIIAYPLLKHIPMGKIDYPMPLACVSYFIAGWLLAEYASHPPTSGVLTTLGDYYAGGAKHVLFMLSAVIVLNFFFAVGIGICLKATGSITLSLVIWMSMMLLAGVVYDLFKGNFTFTPGAGLMLLAIPIMLFGFHLHNNQMSAKDHAESSQQE